MRVKKFALIPKRVLTWRIRQSYAIVWLQYYYNENNIDYCTYLGFFSKEV